MKNLTVGAIAVLAIVAAFSLAGYAQQALDNQGVVKLVKAGLSEDVVLNMISTQPTKFALAPDDIIALKKDGVSDSIIAAMLRKSQPTSQPIVVQPTSSAVVRGVPGEERPSEAQILLAIRSDPNRNDARSPTALALSTTPLGSGSRIRDIDVTIEGFRLIQWGEFSGPGKYWPVEVCVNGTAENRILAQFSPQERSAAGGPRGPSKFQTRTRYRLYKDDFGGLKAEQILVTEWKPQDGICPPGPRSPSAASLKDEPKPSSVPSGEVNDPADKAILENTTGDADSEKFPVHSKQVSKSFNAVWIRVIELLTKQKEKIATSDQEKGVVVTALTRHGVIGFPRYDKYCAVVEKISDTTTRITLKVLSYSGTFTEIGKPPLFVPLPANSVNKTAIGFLDQVSK